jgi:AhpD family alkylhydroperoxidase
VNTATETLFAPLVIATAPDSSKPILEQVEKSYSFIPNLLAILANSPTALQGYLALNAIWEDGSFPPRGRQLILLAASVENECDYCMSVHSSIAHRQECAAHTCPHYIGDPQQHFPSRRYTQCAYHSRERTHSRAWLRKRSKRTELHCGRLSKGAANRTAARHRSQDNQQLLGPYLARAYRSGIRC